MGYAVAMSALVRSATRSAARVRAGVHENGGECSIPVGRIGATVEPALPRALAARAVLAAELRDRQHHRADVSDGMEVRQ